jgi:energy-coupling factor transporter ATP-binding protein EcfA2
LAVNIRKFVLGLHSLEELVAAGSLTEHAARFLEASVAAGVNVLVSGGTQAGKTTMLNALCAAIPARERVVTVEEVFELQVAQHISAVALNGRQAVALMVRPAQNRLGGCSGSLGGPPHSASSCSSIARQCFSLHGRQTLTKFSGLRSSRPTRGITSEAARRHPDSRSSHES